MKTKILALLSTLLLLPLAAHADLHAGDYQLLEVTKLSPFPTSTEVKIVKNKDGDFSVILPKSPFYPENTDAPKELNIRVAEHTIVFSSIIQNNGFITQCIYTGCNDEGNPDSYRGRINMISATGDVYEVRLFVLIPQK